MTRILLLVEGQTEEVFVQELLVPHYSFLKIYIAPIIVSTSPHHRGGVTRYSKIRQQILKLCAQDSKAHVSTMFDLYGLPGDFPGKDISGAYGGARSGHEKASFIESRWAEDIGRHNFIPNIMAHEFEALLFADPSKFADWGGDKVAISLSNEIRKFPSPEDVNEGRSTSPSKRILASMPNYQKNLHGPLIACEISLGAMRRVCIHFDQWLTRLENIS